MGLPQVAGGGERGVSCPWPLAGKKMAGPRGEGWAPARGGRRLDVRLSLSEKAAGGEGWVEGGRAGTSPAPCVAEDGGVVGQGEDVAPSQGGTWECSTWFLCTKGNRGGQGEELR